MRPVAGFRIRERLCVTGGGTEEAEEEADEETEEKEVLLVSGGGEGVTAPRVACGAVVAGAAEAGAPAAVAAAAARGVRTSDIFLPPPLPPGPAHDDAKGGREGRGG